MLILLGLGALWAAVLLPPMIRNRISTSGTMPSAANHLDVYQVPSMKESNISVPKNSSAARRRRRDVLIALCGFSTFTFLIALAVGGLSLWTLHFISDLLLVGYGVLVTQRLQVDAEGSSVILTAAFVSNSEEEEFAYQEAI
tara:strand:- start:125 stop:550 length:426 start_codon:yes stop_codon:yes gene_type:complete